MFFCLPSGSHWGEGVRMVKLVYVSKSLRMDGDSIKSVCPLHLVDRYSQMLGCGRVEGNISKVSPD